ncbi:C6 transcription factor [Lasiodiplodia theobromae]|uniref:C6 transcription factor n=1 Tax=Lasiodiplodia theobromae TaxID=45133 RepID=UPI0015C32A71|nr:C6 transcription factor [Lasiodiplodia theobromae]KAF4546618.1 C6 transcription factor [Lasiodiplodia theobromae]
MILTAVGDRPQEKDAIMGHVLELLAYLHHAGIIPESVYHYEPPKDKYSLQQPPTLYLLSSKILTALSDAAWRAHELAAASENQKQAKYNIFGQEIPGSRYKVRTPELGSEVWLELVLWSCLHGGWTMDGADILKKLSRYKDDSRWARGTQAKSQERFMVDKTISSEVVAAYIDGVLNRVTAGVGLLDRDNLGLGTATWESIIVRFMESGGIDPNLQARWLERLLYFSSKFDEELEYHNAAREYEDSPGSPSYILDPSSISLGVLHQALRIHIKNSNLTGAAEVVSRLQSLTDENKKRSMQKFFEKLNRRSEDDFVPESFSSNVDPMDYPIYFPQIPPALLAGVLSLATQNQAYDFARQLLYSDDIDGPLIPQELYGYSGIAAAITRFGDNDQERYHRFHGILCVLSSIGPEWRDFCFRLFTYRETKLLERCVTHDDFAPLLQGVTETRGAYRGMELMTKWLYQAALKQIEQSAELAWHQQNVRSVLSWALAGLRSLGLSEKEIGHELNGITSGAELAERARAAIAQGAERGE